jgi:hypothetical protein
VCGFMWVWSVMCMARDQCVYASDPNPTTHTSRPYTHQHTHTHTHRLSRCWTARCISNNISLTKAVSTEFQKRINQASAGTSKSKLTLANCSITDAQLVLLAEELAVKPVLCRLDLSGNHITTGVSGRPLRRCSHCVYVCGSVFVCLFVYLSFCLSICPPH